MLQTDRLLAALESKRQQFHESEQQAQDESRLLASALKDFAARTQAELDTALANMPWPGAYPTIEQDTRDFVISFSPDWSNQRDAREWALQVLRGVTTFAADGSQISPSRDLSIPIGVVQVGWFENRHVDDGQGDYVKDVDLQVLAPDELAGEESGLADQKVEWLRFQAELDRANRFMLAHAGPEPRAVAFVDGSLIISFVQHIEPQRQSEYIRAVESLLDTSEATRVPLVGYVDTSYATDLTSAISYSVPGAADVDAADPVLLDSSLGRWGDRCRLYRCARHDRVLPVDGRKYYKRVLFTYLRTTIGGRPARVELPDWVLNENRQDWVLDVVRAECVVGTGYPYVLETADAVAVLTARDREHFLAIFQSFAEREGLRLRFSRKAISKRMRRV